LLAALATVSVYALSQPTLDNVAPNPPAPIPTQFATEAERFNYTVPRFQDPDGDALTYSFNGLPPWLHTRPASRNPRYMTGRPPYSESSSSTQQSYTISYTATDPSGASSDTSFTLTIINSDAAPEPPAAIPTQTAIETMKLAFTVPAFDLVDGDELTYSYSGLPGWLMAHTSAANPRYLKGTPPLSEATEGSTTTYEITVTATDPANQSASAAFDVIVEDSTALSGLDSRPGNTTCIAPERPTIASSVQLSQVFSNLTFGNALGLLQAPDDGSRWFVVQKAGRVRVFQNTPDVTSAGTFVDIVANVAAGGEGGLLGMAFHPDWPATPEAFLSYTRPLPVLQSVISRFTSSDGGLTLDTATEQVILTLDQPQEDHNGGNLAFGPDGMLYGAFGDGGPGNDPNNLAQNLTTLHGKMIRINVDGTGAGYTIPADNPFAANDACPTGSGTEACAEIWAFGFRNPWRWSFDRATGDLWLGDVGQDNWEEVDRIVKGGNYGWRQREGAHCFNPATGCATPGSLLNGGIVIDPVTEYDHATGGNGSVTGGFVYRGSEIPDLVGQYVFADFVSGRFWSHLPGSGGMQKTELFDSSILISTFGEAVDGELYVLSYGGSGKIHKLVPGSVTGTDTIPTLLSGTGCVDATDPTRPAAGLIPFQPNAPFWSDGAAKERFLGLPDGEAISADASGDWNFPNGTVLVKNFRLANKLIETRLFMRHPDGEWGGYTYEWNDTETEATRVVGGKNKLIAGQTWVYPSESECTQCHTEAAGRSLAPETAQLNGNLQYPQTGRTANQVMTLNAIGAIQPEIPGTPSSLPAYRDPYGGVGSLEERARAYLHSNCSQCHRPGGPTPTSLDFRHSTPLSATNACDTPPSQGDLGIANARIIAPGDPQRSLVFRRVQSLDPVQRMPPLGTTVQDAVAVQLLNDWILQLSDCN
jgi:uncharacterized repeat protein (TIGR03806 family)